MLVTFVEQVVICVVIIRHANEGLILPVAAEPEPAAKVDLVAERRRAKALKVCCAV